MTSVIAARQPSTTVITRSLGHGLAWLWHSYVIVIHAITHHQVPPPAPTAVFAVTAAVVLWAALGRKRRRAA